MRAAPVGCRRATCERGRAVLARAEATRSIGKAGRALKVQKLSNESFAAFGQLCTWQEDGKVFDHEDAQLDLAQGTPRFYIMRLHARDSLQFAQITHHKKTTQCLGALGDSPWYMACAQSDVQSPTKDDITVFEVPAGSFIKMHTGTWHAGPLFTSPSHIDFYNLELSDTNVTDHYNVFFDAIDLELPVGPVEQ